MGKDATVKSARAAPLLLGLLSIACASSTGDEGPGPHPPGPSDGGTQADADAGPLPDAGPTLKVGHWNIEFFGSPTQGPSNEDLQLRNVRDILQRLDAQVWGLTEIMDDAQFERLKAQLPAYDGFRASDPRVFDGPTPTRTSPASSPFSTSATRSASRVPSSSIGLIPAARRWRWPSPPRWET
jgi:hypothetical protein